MEVILSPIPVMFVASTNSTAGARKAFDILEAKFPNLKKRHFYGTLEGRPDSGMYRACVVIIEDDDPKALGLQTWTIPGGKYAKAKIMDWHSNLHKVGPTIGHMADQYSHDPTRPTIEFYRSQDELLLFFPIA